MKIVSTEEMLAIEQSVISSGTSAETLMDCAAAGMAEILWSLYGKKRRAVLFLGSGNNAGDGLALAVHLAKAKWKLHLVLTRPEKDFSPLPAKKFAQLLHDFPEISRSELKEKKWADDSPEFVIDAILGLGSSGELKPEIANLILEINERRRVSAFRTIAIDLPTGLAALAKSEKAGKVQDPSKEPALVTDLTLTVGFAKDFLAREELSPWVGAIEVIPIFEKTIPAKDDEILTPFELSSLLPRRTYLSNKGLYGRTLIFGGSAGFSGAPLMSAVGALRTGAGLVELAVPTEIRNEVATRAPFELMVHDSSDRESREKLISKAAALAVGPGMGTGEKSLTLLTEILETAKVPIVIDADALNLVSKNLKLLLRCQSPMILTPHPGEMKRLIGKEFSVKERSHVALEFSRRHDVTLVLKGSRTVIAAQGKPLFYNSSGNPGLATGGSGDTLTGIITALLSQRLTPVHAACLGVWLHGHAADLAEMERGCCEGLLPADIVSHLGKAIESMRKRKNSLVYQFI